MKTAGVLLFFVWVCLGVAQTEVLFLEVSNSNGETVVLEPGFPYAHVMVKIGNNYLHAHPRTGVAWVEETAISRFGVPRESFQTSLKIDNSWIEKHLGKPYDSQFSWGDERFYCSELVAKLLGLGPEPMHFDPSLWPPSFQEHEGKPGISPGKIYRHFIEDGYDGVFEKEKPAWAHLQEDQKLIAVEEDVRKSSN